MSFGFLASTRIHCVPAGRVYRSLMLATSVAATLAVAACASKDDDLVDLTPPDQLYNDGLSKLSKGQTTDAVKKFEDLDRLYPYTDLAKKSILLQAYSNFRKNDFTSAIAASKRFITIYPNSEETAYAYYLIAESYYAQVPDLTRDQAMTQNAYDAYTELLTKFPNSKFSEDARQKQEAVRDQLAGKEMDVGRYYLKQRQFLAAINRFKVVIAKYQTTRHVEEALARLVECYYSLGVIPEAQTAAAVLGHNFPDSKWYKDSFELLKTGGYSPEEDKNSWISKAFSTFHL
jgi:outer membrane protein assembly factor BamD